MKKRTNTFYGLLCCCCLLLLGCQKDYRLHNMVDDSIYLKDHKENKITVYDWGKFEHKIAVVKAGVGQVGGTVRLRIDEAYLASYNEKEGTNYKLLPTTCYQIQHTEVNFDKEQYQLFFDIVFDSEKIKELQGKYTEEYVLPLQIEAADDVLQSLKPEMSEVLLIPSVEDPFLSFTSPGLSEDEIILAPNMYNGVSGMASVSLNYPNKWDVEYEVVVDPKALEDYNATVEATKKKMLLPESAYKLPDMPLHIKAGKRTGTLEFSVFAEALVKAGIHQFGEYCLPLRISKVSQHKIDEGGDVILLPVSYQPEVLDRKGWKVIEVSSEWIGGGERDLILDGNVETFWHNAWVGGEPPLPHYLILDLGKEYNMMAIELSRRTWSNDLKVVEFYISKDNITYTHVGKVDFGPAVDNPRLTLQVNIPPTEGRYLKCIITESNRPPSSSISEIYVKGLE